MYPKGLSTSTGTAISSTSIQSGLSSGSLVDNLPPVKSDSATHADSALSAKGIITLTNQARQQRGLSVLVHNKTLDNSAEAKLEDIFSGQYFEHVSPAGVSVTDLVNKAGYQYIVVGENLALGNFGGNTNVMSAWMASKGHRANILDPRYQEIGVAVGRGMYEGKEQWLAVQHFGKPQSACPKADSQLKSSIESTRIDLVEKEKYIAKEKVTIDSSNLDDPSHREMVEQYNTDVNDYNRELDAFRTAVSQYNEGVKAFNQCAGLTAKA